jgi:hypothetical protein
MSVVAAHDAFMRSADRVRKIRRHLGTAGVLVVAGVIALWGSFRPRHAVAPSATPLTTPAATPAATAVAAVPPGATGTLRAHVEPATATITLDGRPAGRGGALDTGVAPGLRHLHITAGGYVDFDTTVAVAAGQSVQLPAIALTHAGTR